MAWMSPKRRGRAQRRLSGKTQLVRGQLDLGLCPAPRRNCQRKNCCSGRPDHARGHPNSFCGGAHHVGCLKGRSLRTTSLSLRRDSSPQKLRAGSCNWPSDCNRESELDALYSFQALDDRLQTANARTHSTAASPSGVALLAATRSCCHHECAQLREKEEEIKRQQRRGREEV